MTLMTKAPTATSRAYAVVPATDVARAERYYHDTLGMDIDKMPDIPSQFMAKAGEGTWILVYETAAPGGQNTAAMFTVDNLDMAMSDLRDRGVTFADFDMPGLKTVNGVAELGPTRGAWFKDSEGNFLNLAEMRK